MSAGVVELHLHDHYSNLDGLNTPQEYMERAKEMGMTHLAQTNHGSLSGHREFQRQAEAAGITPILGVEAYVSPTDMYDRRSKAKRTDGTDVYNHIILLAQNNAGLDTLNRLSRRAWEEGFYSHPRMDTDLIGSDNEGLIVLSGCLNGLIAKAIEREDFTAAREWACKYKEMLGDRFYIEVQGSNPIHINRHLLDIADSMGIKPVATSDCHYARREDLWVEEAFLILSTNPKKSTSFELSRAKKMDLLDRYNYIYPDRKMTFQEIEIYLRSRQDHADLFAAQEIHRTDILENTLEIASRIESYNQPKGLDLLPATVSDPDAELERMAFAGLKSRGLSDDPEYRKRLEHELTVIKDMGFARYFLMIEDLVRWTRKQKMFVGPGRGSAAGSLLCYCLDVTQVDPIEYGLIFERFLDYSRKGDWPDVDIDWGDKNRSKIKAYLLEKWGDVASIATFNTIGGRSAIKDAAKVLGISHVETNAATKNNEAPAGADYFDHFVQSEQSRGYAAKHPEVIKLARRLEGRIRGTGIHASGVVVSNRPIEEIAPYQTGKEPGGKSDSRISYVAVDMNDAAEIGLIKMDILGLETLSVLEDARDLVNKRKGVFIDYYTLPLDDREVYRDMERGHTVGVFQAEGAAMKKWLMDSKCEEFNDLVVGTSIARPGPMNTIGPMYKATLKGSGNSFIENREERAIVEETLGYVIYQEQVMHYMTDLAGMTKIESNQVRRIIGKKKTDAKSVALMNEYKEKFVQGAGPKIGTSRAKQLWKNFEAHAGYSFNKSHAVAYSMITYWTAWMKHHHPLEFMTAALMNTDDNDKITNYIIEARRLGLEFKLPHINHSQRKASIYEDKILFGLTNIKFISDGVADKIVAERPFDNYDHVIEVSKRRGSGINTRAIAGLDRVNAICFEDHPAHEIAETDFYEILNIPSIAKVDWIDYNNIRALEDFDSEDTFVCMALVRSFKNGPHWTLANLLDSTGTDAAFLNRGVEVEQGKVYLLVVSNNSIVRAMELGEEPGDTPIERYVSGEYARPEEGEVVPLSFTPRKTKNGADMASMVVLDHLNELHGVVVFSSLFYHAYQNAHPGRPVKMLLTEQDGKRELIYNGTAQ